MIFRKLKNNKAFVIISTILLAVLYIEPTGIQLKFCFGEDGHFDVSTGSESFSQPMPVGDHPTSNEEHHGKCSDFTSTCNDKVSCRMTSDLIFSSLITGLINTLPALYFENAAPIKYFPRISFPSFISEQGNFISSIISSTILLI